MGENTKNSVKKIVCAIFVLLFAISTLPLFSQTASSSTEAQTESNEKSLTELQQKENETFSEMFSQDKTEKTDTEKAKKTPSTFWLFFRTLLVLILVIVAIYFIFKFVKKTTNPSGPENDPFIKKVASLNISGGKSVQIITVQNHCYVLGVADNSVELIDTLDYDAEKDKDLIDAMNFHKDSEPTGKRKDFRTILATVMGVKKKDATKSTDENVANLKNQLNRLKQSSINNSNNEGEKPTEQAQSAQEFENLVRNASGEISEKSENANTEMQK